MKYRYNRGQRLTHGYRKLLKQQTLIYLCLSTPLQIQHNQLRVPYQNYKIITWSKVRYLYSTWLHLNSAIKVMWNLCDTRHRKSPIWTQWKRFCRGWWVWLASWIDKVNVSTPLTWEVSPQAGRACFSFNADVSRLWFWNSFVHLVAYKSLYCITINCW